MCIAVLRSDTFLASTMNLYRTRFTKKTRRLTEVRSHATSATARLGSIWVKKLRMSQDLPPSIVVTARPMVSRQAESAILYTRYSDIQLGRKHGAVLVL